MTVNARRTANAVACVFIAIALAAWSGRTARADSADRLAAALTAAAELEAECLLAVQGASSGAQAGRLYAGVARAYARCGSTGIEKVIEYCQLALACPQQVLDRVRLTADWGHALLGRPAADAEQTAANRQQAVTKYLQGLNVVLAHQTAARPQPIPRSGPARQAVLLQNNLICWREALIECVVEAYRDGGTKAELEQLAGSTVSSSVVVQEILARCDKLLPALAQ